MIYCVEDDEGIRSMMIYTLKASGMDACGFGDSSGFFQALEKQKPELVLLDIMLPGQDGISILHQLRDRPSTADIPVIMTTAKGTEYDKITGLDAGADDYLAKPFGMMEMVSRVKAVLRRSQPKKENILTSMNLTLDPFSHTVKVDGNPVELTLKEFDLLQLFLENPGQVFTRDVLLDRIWNLSVSVETRTVDVHIRSLRLKLNGWKGTIETVRGMGYRLEKPV